MRAATPWIGLGSRLRTNTELMLIYAIFSTKMTCKYDKTDEEAEEHKTFLEKYFEPKYFIVPKDQVTGDGFEDYCILQHSNKVCVLTLAEGHSLLEKNKMVTEVDFQITPNTNRMDNKVIGKAKRGAQWLTHLSPICRVKCSDDSAFTLRSSLPGKLIEVNERLSENPALLTGRIAADNHDSWSKLIIEQCYKLQGLVVEGHSEPFTEGYLAIIIPKPRDWEAASPNFLSRESYLSAIAGRSAGSSNGSIPDSMTEAKGTVGTT